MARMHVDGDDLVVELGALEKVGALMGSVRVPLASVRGARITEEPYRELRGMRVGTGIPWVIVLGRMVWSGGTDMVAVYGTKPSAVVDLEGERFTRLLVSGVDEATVAAIRARIGSAPS